MRTLCLVLALGSLPVGAQSQEDRDALRMEGSFVRDARREDLRLLGSLVQTAINTAQARDTKLPPRAAALLNPIAYAFGSSNDNMAWRLATRFLLFARGAAWGDAQEAAASFDFKTDRRIAAPGDILHARLDPLYTLGRSLQRPLTIEIGLLPGGAVRKLTVESLVPAEVTLPTAGLAAGDYEVSYRLSDGAQTLVEVRRALLIDGTVRARVATLRQQWKTLSAAAGKSATVQAALDSVEYILDTVERAQSQYVGSFHQSLHPFAEQLRPKDPPPDSGPVFDLTRDLALTQQFLEVLKTGRDPLARAEGDSRMAFRSSADRSLQPYRLFLPAMGTGDRKWPLVIALHGASGDENSYFDSYHAPGGNESLLKKLAAERGYIVVCPGGRGAFHFYEGPSAAEVTDLLDTVLAVLPVDRDAVFLMGHDMGALGALHAGTQHPERFAAIAAVAGVAPAERMNLELAVKMRLHLYQGAADLVMLPSIGRNFAAFAKYRFKDFVYIEHKDDDHASIVITTMPEIFDWFDSLRKTAPGK